MLTTDSTLYRQLFNVVRAKVADLQEGLGATNIVIQFNVEDSYATLVTSFKRLVGNFRAGLNKLVSKAFRTGFIGSMVYPDASIKGITLFFSEDATTDDDGGSTKSEDIVIH